MILISFKTMGSIFIDSPTTQPSISHLDLSFNPTPQLLLEGPSNPQDTIGFSPRDFQLPFIGVNSPQYFEALDQSAFCPNDLWKAEMTTKTSGNDNKRTTLCSLAFRLVAQCNKRGVDLQVIHIWMQHGFQLAMASNEGCRVDNQVLLDILTQIS